MGWIRRLRNLTRRRALNRDLEREISFHIAERIDELVAAGMSEEEARYVAGRRFGSYALQKERTRDMDINRWLESVAQDIRYGLRMTRKSPLFAAIVVLSLSIGLGANATLFSLIDAMLLRPLPVPNAEELVVFDWKAAPDWPILRMRGTTNRDPITRELTSTSFSPQMARRFAEETRLLSDVFSFAPLFQVTLSADGQPEVAPALLASGNYFSALRVAASAGRMFSEADERDGNPVVVISDRYWERRFGRSAGVVGKPIVVNGVPLNIVGVAQPNFIGTSGFGVPADVFIPMGLEARLQSNGPPSPTEEPWFWWVRVMGRARPGITAEQVHSELEHVFQAAAIDGWKAAPLRIRETEAIPQARPRLRVRSGNRGLSDLVEDSAFVIVPLAAISGILLIIVCVNVANLMLARSAARQNELSIRLSLGGSRTRVIRQLLTEVILLSLAGGALSVAVAYWAKNLLITVLPQTTVAPYDLRIGPTVLLFTVAASIMSGILVGIAPAFRATRENVNRSLKENSRTLVGPRNRLSKGLLMAQISLSMILLVGAGVFVQTVRNLQSVDVGFDPNNLLLFGVNPGPLKYGAAKTAAFYQEALDRIAATPGVRSVTLSDYPLVGNAGNTDRIHVPGIDIPTNRSSVNLLTVRPNFFDVFDVPVLSGRGFNTSDWLSGARVAIINEAMAHSIFGNESPIGKRIGYGRREANIEIIGVTKNISVRPARDPIRSVVYSPDTDGVMGGATFAIRTIGDPEAMINTVRETVRQIDSNIPLQNIRSQRTQIENGFSIERIFATSTAFFGGIALLLACIGLFGLMSYSVERRTSEIGVRMALGARRIEVVQLVMRQTFMLVFLGIIIGFVASLGFLRLMVGLPFVFRVAPNDPSVFGVALFTLIAVACVAAYFPARRAARVDPSIALRCE